jgi:lysophospholipase L1-like esterase
LRIVCIGGSTTYGVAVRDNADTYPARLEVALKESPLPDWSAAEVYNLGVGGYTTAEMLPLFHFYALPLEPDVVLIHCAINDVAPRFYDHFQCDYSHFRTPWRGPEATWVERLFYRSYAVLWAGWKLGWIEPLTLQSRTQRPLPPPGIALDNLQRNTPACFRRNLEAIVALAKARGVRVWLITQAYLEHDDFLLADADARQLEKGYRDGQVEHNEVMRNVAADMGVGLIDLAEATPREREYFADPIHMTPAGNTFKAAYIAQVLRRELQ